MRVELCDAIGPRCITVDQGKALYEKIYPALQRGESVVVDLAGVRSLVSLFLNHAIGVLFKDFDRQTLDSLLKFENASEAQLETIARVMENSERYFKDPDYQKVVDEVIARQFEEESD